jgi:hypothetical protein
MIVGQRAFRRPVLWDRKRRKLPPWLRSSSTDINIIGMVGIVFKIIMDNIPNSPYNGRDRKGRPK